MTCGSCASAVKAEVAALPGVVEARVDLAAGRWSTTLRLPAPGSYRVLARFRPAGAAQPVTLGVDVSVGGSYQPQQLPAPSRVADVGGLQVTVSGWLRPGTDSRLMFLHPRRPPGHRP